MTDKNKLPGHERLCIDEVVAFQENRNLEAAAITAPGRTPLTYQVLHEQINDLSD